MSNDAKFNEINDQIKAHLQQRLEEDARHTALGRKYANSVLDRTLIYGGPMDKLQKLVLKELKKALSEQGVAVEKEIFEFSCPLDHMFFFTIEKGWTVFSTRLLKENLQEQQGPKK